MKTVIEMAREAGFSLYRDISAADGSFASLERFAALVRADEREAFAKIQFESILQAMRIERESCAKVCDDWPNGRDDVYSIGVAIRARGEIK